MGDTVVSCGCSQSSSFPTSKNGEGDSLNLQSAGRNKGEIACHFCVKPEVKSTLFPSSSQVIKEIEPMMKDAMFAAFWSGILPATALSLQNLLLQNEKGNEFLIKEGAELFGMTMGGLAAAGIFAGSLAYRGVERYKENSMRTSTL